MRKFNSSALLTPHSYLSTVSELLEAANKIRPNSDAEIKVLFYTTLLGSCKFCVLSIQAKHSGKFTTPEDVAGLASFLVSEDAAMITGMLYITSRKYFQLRGNRQDKVWVPMIKNAEDQYSFKIGFYQWRHVL